MSIHYRQIRSLLALSAVLFLTILFGCASDDVGTSVSQVSPRLVSIHVYPASSEIPVGKTLKFKAFGSYTDARTRDLTSQVKWTSSNPTLAAIDGTGTATGLSPGATTISASFSGFTGKASLNIDTSVLKSIIVHPVNSKVAVGHQVGFVAIGSYSDGDKHDLTEQVTWSSSSNLNASISNTGAATGIRPGIVTITASMGNIKGTAKLTVDKSLLNSIDVRPANTSVAVGESQQFKATGNYSDGDTRDLTSQVNWTVGNPAVAKVEKSGMAMGLTPGKTPVVASLSGKSGSSMLSVTGFGTSDFPTYDKNIFSIQYRNSTTEPIKVWFMGTKPPCSKAEADKTYKQGEQDYHNCWAGSGSEDWANEWARMNRDGVFTRSGTAFYVRKTDGTINSIDVSTSVILQPGEVLRVVPPIIDENTGPEWYYNETSSADGMTSGTTTWVTKPNINMPAPQSVLLYEFNLDVKGKLIWYDIGAVDGLNANATATYTGCSPEQKKQCMTNLAAYNGTNEGCPYIIQRASANVCPNPKFYPADINISPKPEWLVGQSKFTTEKLSSVYPNYYKDAGSPSGPDLASAASGEPLKKKAYHIWWSTNPVAQGWLKYLQHNKAGLCDAYGWAYDEKRWVPSECNPNEQKCFEDDTGNPPDNKDIKALIQCPFIPNSYLNIDILYVM